MYVDVEDCGRLEEHLQVALAALREIAALPHSPDCDQDRKSACACVIATAALKELGE